MKKNSFKELESMIIRDRKDDGTSIKEQIQTQVGLFRLIGDIIELYGPNMPKVLQGFISKSNAPALDHDAHSSTE
ncbi:MAG: hypothetical protein LC107_13170 [Chitinophagales bacterium]|nr:hypothetical protein [Chitinophagales bacterium]